MCNFKAQPPGHFLQQGTHPHSATPFEPMGYHFHSSHHSITCINLLICLFGGGAHVPWYLCGGQKRPCGSWFSPSIIVDPRDLTQIIRLGSQCPPTKPPLQLFSSFFKKYIINSHLTKQCNSITFCSQLYHNINLSPPLPPSKAFSIFRVAQPLPILEHLRRNTVPSTHHFSSTPYPWAIKSLFSVAMDSPVMCISHKWNHPMCV